MPYPKGVEDPSLPANVKRLSAIRRRQWLEAYNSGKSRNMSDGDAIRMANGVIKKQMGHSMAKGGHEVTDEFAQDLLALAEFDTEADFEIEADLSERLLAIEAGQECGDYYGGGWGVVAQDEALYGPYGFTGEQGCANCRFFRSPNRCVIVSGDISPTGRSKYYEPYPTYDPAGFQLLDAEGDPIDLVEVLGSSSSETPTPAAPLAPTANGEPAPKRNAFRTVMEFFGLGSNDELPAHPLGVEFPSEPMFSLQEGTDGPMPTPPGRMRYWAVASNNFMPDNKGVGFPTSAQQDYVDWVWEDPSTRMAELQIWHTPGTRLGQDDWVEYDGHFLHSTGLIEAGQEELARRYADDPSIAMSHGYVVVWDEQNRAIGFRSYEKSVLPRKYAGNSYTSFGLVGELGQEEVDVGFTEPRKAFLRQAGLSDKEIDAREVRWEQFGTLLTKMGIGSHELEVYVDSLRAENKEGETAEGTPAADATAAAAATPAAADTTTPAAAAVSGQQAGNPLPTENMTMAGLAEMVGSIIDQKITPLQTAISGLQARDSSVDAAVAAAFRNQQPAAGFDATKTATGSPVQATAPDGAVVAAGTLASDGISIEPLDPKVAAVIADGHGGEIPDGATINQGIGWLTGKLQGTNPVLNGKVPVPGGRG